MILTTWHAVKKHWGSWIKTGSTEPFKMAVKILCIILSRWAHVIIHLSKPIECTAPRESFWVTEMCQCRFIRHNTCIIWVRDVGNGRLCMCEGRRI